MANGKNLQSESFNYTLDTFVTSGTLPPVALKPAANLPPVSTTPTVLVAKFAAGVVDTGGAP